MKLYIVQEQAEDLPQEPQVFTNPQDAEACFAGIVSETRLAARWEDGKLLNPLTYEEALEVNADSDEMGDGCYVKEWEIEVPDLHRLSADERIPYSGGFIEMGEWQEDGDCYEFETSVGLVADQDGRVYADLGFAIDEMLNQEETK